MFTLIGFSQTEALTAVYDDLTALADQHITVSGDDVQIPLLNQIVMAAAMVVGALTPGVMRVRLATPSMRERALFQISPINGLADTAGAELALPLSPHRLVDLRTNPVVLVPREKINAQVYTTNVGATDRHSVLVWLADGPIAPVAGPIFTVRTTGGSAAVAGAWTASALTFDEDLPAGRYQIVGMRAISTTMIGARLVFVGGGWRPGVLGSATPDALSSPIFRYGQMGVFGEFEDLEPPTTEIFCASADAAAVQEFWLDLIQIRKGPGA